MGTDGRSAGDVLREARRRAGLSQRALGARAGVTQSVISAYEQGRREPSLPMLHRLVEATGMRLHIEAQGGTGAKADTSAARPVSRPLRAVVAARRQDVLALTARLGITQVQLFGSVARGDDDADSDVDLLVDLPPGLGLIGLARVQRELEELLGVPVDVVPRDGLKPHLRERVLAEAVSL